MWDSSSTAVTIWAIEKNTCSNAGSRSWSTDSPASDLRCRSIQALSSPIRRAGTWAWRMLWAVWRTSAFECPRSVARCSNRY